MKKPSRPEISPSDWADYRANPTSEFESRAMRIYGYLVAQYADQFARKNPPGMERADLYQAGNVGLLQAIRNYNPEAGAKFPTFATWRVRGEILDQINANDWTPKNIRAQIKRAIKVIEKIRQSAGSDEVSAELVAKELPDLSTEEVKEVLNNLNRTYVHSVDTADEAYQFGQEEDFSEKLSMIMSLTLDRDEQIVVHLKYLAGYTHQDIIDTMREKYGRTDFSMKDLDVLRKSALEKLKNSL